MKHERLINRLRNVGLTEREADIALMVTMGLSNAEIANQLFVTQSTVKFHVQAIYTKLNINSRAKLIVMCLPFTDEAKKYTDIAKGE